jgi:Protein of unknown function (DUF3618)
MTHTAELEREAEAARARVASTAESLRAKMTPGQMIDEMTGRLTHGDGWTAFNNLKAQMRDNPLPLTLVGAGLAWLMFGQGASHARHRGDGAGFLGWARKGDGSEHVGPAFYASEPAGHDGGGMTDRISEAAGSAAEMAGDAADTMRHAYAGAKDSLAGARDSLAGAGQGVAGGARGIAARSRNMGAHARETAGELFEREPLVLAALGLTLGTAIGAMLPHTRLEDETMGSYGEQMRRAGEELYEKGVREAKDVAADVYDAAKEEADRQGLTGDDRPVAERISEVMKTAAETTEDAIRDKTETQTKRG